MQSAYKTVFVVDEQEDSLNAVKQALGDDYKVFAMPTTAKLYKLMERVPPDVILMDIESREEEAWDTLETLKSDMKYLDIPVILLTSKRDEVTEARALTLGAADLMSKPVFKQALVLRLEAHIRNAELAHTLEVKVRERTDQVFKMQNAILQVIADVVESRDKITGGHIERTQQYLTILWKELRRRGVYADQTSDWDERSLLPSAQLHDLGKIAISDNILNKPSRLTENEFEVMKSHCIEGEELIRKIMDKTGQDASLENARLFACSHHEKWDGTGYPNGIKGLNIPLQGRLMAIADVYDALVSERPYKKAFTHDQACEIIKQGSGTQFDPALIEVFAEAEDEFWAVNELGDFDSSEG